MSRQHFVKTVTITLYDGSKKRIKKRGYSQKEVDEKINKAIWEYENGLLELNPRSTLSAWAKEWLDVYARPNMTQTNCRDYETILNKHILPDLGKVPLGSLLPSQIQRCVNKMSDYSASYINKTKIVLNGLLKTAKENRLVREDLYSGIVYPKGASGARRELNPQERELFLSAIKKHPKGLLFGSMYALGLRPGEARALMWSDFSGDTVHIQRAIKKDTNMPGPPKTKSGNRVIPVPPWFKQMLDAAPRTSLYVTSNTNGDFISATNMKKAWNSLKRLMYLEAGVPTYRNQIIEEQARRTSIYELTPYYLRHTYATILAENGVDIATAQYLLGHADIGMTANVYTHMNDKRLLDAKNVIDFIDYSGTKTRDKGETTEINYQLKSM